jgi:hypothetical protein
MACGRMANRAMTARRGRNLLFHFLDLQHVSHLLSRGYWVLLGSSRPIVPNDSTASRQAETKCSRVISCPYCS